MASFWQSNFRKILISFLYVWKFRHQNRFIIIRYSFFRFREQHWFYICFLSTLLQLVQGAVWSSNIRHTQKNWSEIVVYLKLKLNFWIIFWIMTTRKRHWFQKRSGLRARYSHEKFKPNTKLAELSRNRSCHEQFIEF